jgi:hypothetical protein
VLREDESMNARRRTCSDDIGKTMFYHEKHVANHLASKNAFMKSPSEDSVANPIKSQDQRKKNKKDRKV